jgi:hypothetical protein
VKGELSQFAYCNAVNFFEGVRTAANNGLLIIPSLGTALDGLPCPTTRDFLVVDMDPSDNVLTTYIVKNGLVAQNTPANRTTLMILLPFLQ